MAILHISEYNAIHRTNVGDDPPSGDGIAQTIKEPSITTQAIPFTSATSSAAFNDSTRLVRVASDTQCYIVFGAAPTATANSMLFPSHGVEYFGVNPGDKISVYDGTT